jgi:hypothetical protein
MNCLSGAALHFSRATIALCRQISAQRPARGIAMLAFEILGAVFTVLFLAALVGGNNTVADR